MLVSFDGLRSALRATKNKKPHSGFGEWGKQFSYRASCPPRTGRELAPSDQRKTLVRLSWRHRARNPSATLHEDRVTPIVVWPRYLSGETPLRQAFRSPTPKDAQRLL